MRVYGGGGVGSVITNRELGNSTDDAACAIKRSAGSLRTQLVDSLLRQRRANPSVPECSNHRATIVQTEEGLSKFSSYRRLRAKLGFTNSIKVVSCPNPDF